MWGTAYLFRRYVSSAFRETASPTSRPSQRPRPRGRNTVTIAHDFSSCSLMVTFEDRICRIATRESHVCSYRDSIQGVSNFFPLRSNFACTDRQLRHVARMNVRLKAHALHSRDGTPRDRVCTRFSASANVSSKGVVRAVTERETRTPLFLFFDTVSRVRDSTTVAMQREIGISASQRTVHGPLYNSHERNARLVIRLTSTVSSVLCVLSRSIGR